MLKINYHQRARDELTEAGLFYSGASQEVGVRFFEKYEQAMSEILSFPQAFPEVEGEVRRCLIHKFPFSICYRIESDIIRILAVAHTSRHPDYWKGAGKRIIQ